MSQKESFFDRLARVQARRSWWIVVAGFVLAGLSFPLMARLGLNSQWAALLPKNTISVRDMDQAANRVAGLTTVAVCVESRDLAAMERFARALVPRLERMKDGPLEVRAIDWTMQPYKDFLHKHRYLYAPMDDLRQLRDGLSDRLEYENLRQSPLYVDLDDEPPPDIDGLVSKLRKKAERARSKLDRFPDGFYVHPNHDVLAIFVRTDLSGGDAAGTHRLIRAIDREVAALGTKSYAPDLRVEYGGDLRVASEEHDAVVKELATATTLTIVLVLLSIFGFFFRMRSILLLGASLLVPVIVTFAIAQITVSYLNAATAFLGSIVVGNGINPMIIWLARFFEERRRSEDLTQVLSRTHHGTWLATLSASGAASVAYGSLIVTDFRGFRDFGIIGGIGMIVCWVGSLLFLPALAAAYDRIRPLTKGRGLRRQNRYGLLARKLVFGAPVSILVVSAVLIVASSGMLGWFIAHDPIEYDFHKLQSVRETTSTARMLNRKITEMKPGGSGSGAGIAILVPDRKEVAPLRAEMIRRRDKEGAPWGEVRTIDDLLPKDQRAKLVMLGEVRSLLLKLRAHADDEQRKEIDENMPPARLKPVNADDLPREVARPFTERDGTRGRILFVEQSRKASIWDGRYLIKWSAALRQLRLTDGTRPPLVGRAPIFADMLDVVFTDGPKAVLASFLATCLLVLVSFKRMRPRLLTLSSLLVGIAWMMGVIALSRIKLNFLNFVALPISFGIGVDYAVNVMRRFSLEERQGASAEDAVRASLDETGGAVILCSLTTIFGYISLFTSANRALNSFGSAMTISEVTCLTAAVVTLPAMLLVLSRRRDRKRQVAAELPRGSSARDDQRGDNAESLSGSASVG